MATPNSQNPKFGDLVTGSSFEAVHGNGISTTAVVITGTTHVDLFGTTNGFRGTITGLFFSALTGTSSTITVKSGSTGATVATITAGSSNGTVTGINATLANTAIDLSGTLQAVSSDALDVGTLFVTYKCDED